MIDYKKWTCDFLRCYDLKYAVVLLYYITWWVTIWLPFRQYYLIVRIWDSWSWHLIIHLLLIYLPVRIFQHILDLKVKMAWYWMIVSYLENSRMNWTIYSFSFPSFSLLLSSNCSLWWRGIWLWQQNRLISIIQIAESISWFLCVHSKFIEVNKRFYWLKEIQILAFRFLENKWRKRSFYFCNKVGEYTRIYVYFWLGNHLPSWQSII